MEIKDAALKHLWDAERERFVRRITVDRKTGAIDADVTIDASLYGVFQFGMLPADDPMVVATMEQIEERLWCRTDIGGVARYENDYYHQISQDVGNVPGNPWIICTLWLAEWYIAKAKTLSDLTRALDILEWVRKHTLEFGRPGRADPPLQRRPDLRLAPDLVPRHGRDDGPRVPGQAGRAVRERPPRTRCCPATWTCTRWRIKRKPMTLTLELPPDVEARLKRNAAVYGKDCCGLPTDACGERSARLT